MNTSQPFKSRLMQLTSGLVLVVAAGMAQAAIVTIDPNGLGVAGANPARTTLGWEDGLAWYFAPQALEKATGGHSVATYMDSSRIAFSVDDSGNVTTSDSRATGGVGILTFNTMPVDANASDGTLQWAINADFGQGWMTGDQSVKFIRGTFRIDRLYPNTVQYNFGTLTVPEDTVGWSYTFTDPLDGATLTFSGIPEPATMSLLVLGGMGVLLRRKRNRQ